MNFDQRSPVKEQEETWFQSRDGKIILTSGFLLVAGILFVLFYQTFLKGSKSPKIGALGAVVLQNV